MVEALNELVDFVLLKAFLREIKELLVVLRCDVEISFEDFQKLFIHRHEQVLQVNRLETTQQICAIRVLVHVKHVQLFTNEFGNFLHRCCLASTGFTNEEK